MSGNSRNPRKRNGNARRKLRAWLESRGDPCAICGRPIDYSLPPGDPMSFEVDEIIPVSRYQLGGYESPEAAALDRDNVQATHRICNQRKGSKIMMRRATEGEGSQVVASRDWSA